LWPDDEDRRRKLVRFPQLNEQASVEVIWPLANMVVLLMGLDSSAAGIKALSWWYQHRSGPLDEYLLT
jgi:hypothetical protein